jgi:hypothetical protein
MLGADQIWVVDSKKLFLGRKKSITGNKMINTMRERTILMAFEGLINENLMAHNKNEEVRAPANRATFA